MGLAYLPTFTININPNVGKDASPMDPMGVNSLKLTNRSGGRNLPKEGANVLVQSSFDIFLVGIPSLKLTYPLKIGNKNPIGSRIVFHIKTDAGFLNRQQYDFKLLGA